MRDHAIEGSDLRVDHYKNLQVFAKSIRHCDHDDQWIPVDSLAVGAENFAGMVVQSPMMRRLVRAIVRLAPYHATLLIQGESGTGKELVAHALHHLGSMPTGPYGIFNCSNLVGPLAEAQLFGHVRGAFTDRLCLADFPSLSKSDTPQSGPSQSVRTESSDASDSANSGLTSLRETAERATRNALIRALRETGGNSTRAAQLLGVSRYTVYRLIARHGLARGAMYEERGAPGS